MSQFSAREVFTPKTLAPIASKMAGYTVTDKDVRDLARGSGSARGKAVIARIGELYVQSIRVSHVYNVSEATALLTAIAARAAIRTGHTPALPSWAKGASRKARAASPKGTLGTSSGRRAQPKRPMASDTASAPNAAPDAS